MSLAQPALEAPEAASVPALGQFVLMEGISWERYLALSEDFDGTRVRLTYLDGLLEIMPPPISEEHESRSSHLGHLIAEYCLHAGIRFWAQGSRILRVFEQAGLEPDKQFCLGEKKELPDLALEVGITSGGLNKLSVYRRFEIPEVWIWEAEHLHVHLFDPATGRYQPATASAMLPGIDLSAVARCARIEESGAAILEFRKSLS
jgi:Uma2 family endonuclease